MKTCTCGHPEDQHIDNCERCFTLCCSCREFENTDDSENDARIDMIEEVYREITGDSEPNTRS